MNPPTAEPATESRECGECGQMADYTPVLYDGRDLMRDLPFVCDDCDRRHQVEEERAARAKVTARRLRTWEAMIDAKYRETDIDHPDFNRPVWDALRKHDPAAGAVALIGPAGRSKTRMLALMAKRLIAQDVQTGWTTANGFQWAAQREFDDREGNTAREKLEGWKAAQVLFLDDLGKQRWTDTVEASFFGLMEARSSAKLVTHWSMNPCPTDAVTRNTLELFGRDIIARGLDSTGQAQARARFAPILSRLMDGTLLVPVA